MKVETKYDVGQKVMSQKKLKFKGRCAADTEYGVYEYTPVSGHII